ncbi:uncharacterized protein LOC129616260 [Condylostylus longicornis]|uniref:uncharacterized protein LOC129616260 n=1 Tax=Condylostylus longicornis TaxID=2530218 RepID=UPI00244E08B1|nr:uncharacterized protein LOC129616260 [Condylostylus longicornis]
MYLNSKLVVQQYFWGWVLYILLYVETAFFHEFKVKPIVYIELSSHGFHRNLAYFIEFEHLVGKQCEYAIEQKFSSDVYVNVDQLSCMVRQKKLVALYPSYINEEVSSGKSLPFSVLLFGTPKLFDSVILPIHFRYQIARKTNFVKVEIQKPSLYIKCQVQNDKTIKISQSNHKFCIRNTEFVPDRFVSDEICDWHLLDYELHLRDALVVSVPVGDSNLLLFTFYATIGVSWMGCFSVLCTIYKKNGEIS